jgi:hypothetical protein
MHGTTGAKILASTINNSTATPYYPAACTNVVAVSATDNNENAIDTIAPTATITPPINGATITSTDLQIAVSASDDVGVTQVSIYVDNILKCTDTTAPYTCNWNTKKAASGSP